MQRVALRLQRLSPSALTAPRKGTARFAPAPARSHASAAPAAATASAPVDDGGAPPKPPSRWQKLREARRAAPPPKRRSTHEFDRTVAYGLGDALRHVRAAAWAEFDEAVELVFRLKLDPRRAEQNIRGVADLPHGSGRPVKVAVFAHPGPAADAARGAGAELVGGDDLVDAVLESRGKNLAGFAACLATPEIVPGMASKVGRILGPRGLMPSAKAGSVTGALAEAVAKLKKGQCSFRVDRFGNVHVRAGKLSFSDEQLAGNVLSLTRSVMAARPESVKKNYMLAVHVCSSMGPSAKLDAAALSRLALDPAQLPPLGP